MVDGKQEVALLVGARGLPEGQIRTNAYSANNSRLLVFRAGGGAALPTAMPAVDPSKLGVRIDPPLLTANSRNGIRRRAGLRCQLRNLPWRERRARRQRHRS